MVRIRGIACAVLLACASSALASWSAPLTSAGAAPSFSPPRSATILASHDSTPASRLSLLNGNFAATPLPQPTLEPSSSDLPPTPRSLWLALSGLVALGAVKGARSAQRLGWSYAPDWYHTGAAQVGHVRVLDLDSLTAMPVVCAFGVELSATIRVERPWLDACDLPPPPFIPTRAPRSPPAAALCA